MRLVAEWQRLGRLFPAIDRVGVSRRGQVAMSQDEAWQFMTVVGPTLATVGFDVRLPALSRRKARPSLRLFAEAPADSVVGAHQLSNVAWSVLFDDVELTADDVRRLARQARPLVQSRGRWVEVDRFDVQQAAAALAERENVKQLTGAEILRHSIGLGGSGIVRRRRRSGQQLGQRHRPQRRAKCRWRRSLSRMDSTARCVRTRPRPSPGSGSSTLPVSAAAWRSTWASARRRRCSPTSPARRAMARHW